MAVIRPKPAPTSSDKKGRVKGTKECDSGENQHNGELWRRGDVDVAYATWPVCHVMVKVPYPQMAGSGLLGATTTHMENAVNVIKDAHSDGRQYSFFFSHLILGSKYREIVNGSNR